MSLPAYPTAPASSLPAPAAPVASAPALVLAAMGIGFSVSEALAMRAARAAEAARLAAMGGVL